MNTHEQTNVWGTYVNYDEVARFTYGRRLWRQPTMQRRLLAHWTDERHPHRERFLAQRPLLEDILSSDEPLSMLDERLKRRGSSLRAAAREIPSVFGSFFQ